jgi:hypothetical protein
MERKTLIKAINLVLIFIFITTVIYTVKENYIATVTGIIDLIIWWYVREKIIALPYFYDKKGNKVKTKEETEK